MSDQPKQKICFIISQIGTVGSPEREQADVFMNFIVRQCPEIKKFNYKAIRSDEIPEPGRITNQVINLLLESDLVIADLTGLNANVFYEMAIRHATKKPIITLMMDGTRIPFDVQDLRTIPYTTHVRDVETAKRALGKQLEAVQDPNHRPPDPIGEAQQVISLKTSPVTVERTLGELLQVTQDIVNKIARMENRETMSDTMYRAAIADVLSNKKPPYATNSLYDKNVSISSFIQPKNSLLDAISSGLIITPNKNINPSISEEKQASSKNEASEKNSNEDKDDRSS